jgi:low affinity Fe/Cu permease
MDEVFSASSFLLLFLLQRSQTKATLAMQVKLNELLAAAHRASPVLINVEDRTESEVQQIHDQFQEIQQRGPGAHSIFDLLEGEPPTH